MSLYLLKFENLNNDIKIEELPLAFYNLIEITFIYRFFDIWSERNYVWMRDLFFIWVSNILYTKIIWSFCLIIFFKKGYVSTRPWCIGLKKIRVLGLYFFFLFIKDIWHVVSINRDFFFLSLEFQKLFLSLEL
jgi:hypothetical protein